MTRLANLGYHEKYSETAQSTPQITVYFLQASRSIRTVWLLEELGIPYKLEFADRENMKAPQAMREACGNPLGKLPSIRDRDVVVYESGAIAEYLCDHYSTSSRLLPTSNAYLRSRIQIFIHAAEGTLLIHALAILYFRWAAPSTLSPEVLAETEKNMSANVVKDLDWLEGELAASSGNYLVGNEVTAADCMCLLSVQFIFARGLGVKGCEGRWKRIREWVRRCEGTEGYRRAVEKSGHTLSPETT